MTQVWTVKDGALVRRSAESGQSDTFVIGTTKPSASNTGVPAGTVFTSTVTSPVTLTISTAQTITNTDFACYVKVTAPVNFVNCRFRGPTNPGYVSMVALVDNNDSGAIGSTYTRCTFNADTPYYWLAGLSGQGYRATRCDFSATCDGSNIRAQSPCIIEGNYYHEFFFDDTAADWATSNPPYWSHNDGIQIRQSGGDTTSRLVDGQTISRHIIRGNYFNWSPGLESTNSKFSNNAPLYTGVSGSYITHTTLSTLGTGRLLWGSGITNSPDFGPWPTNTLITKNWFDGGGSFFQCNYSTTFNHGEISYNRCGRDTYLYSDHGYHLRWASTVTVTGWETNVWDDVDTVPVAWRNVAMTQGFPSASNSGGIEIGI